MTSPTPHTTTDNGTADPLQAYLDLGLRNYWYPVAPSWQVGNAPIGLTRLGDQAMPMHSKTAARTAARVCRWAGISAAASHAGITALKSTAAVQSPRCRPFRTARSKARSV
jgi:hypothetical protein